MNSLTQIYTTLKKLKRATCGEIAQEIPLTRHQVEQRISKLVRSGKVKVLVPKGGTNINGNAANIYSIVNPQEQPTTQTQLF